MIVASPLEEDYLNLSAQTVEISDLRVQFKVEKSLEKNPNSAEIKITNLSEHTRASMTTFGSKVILRAGYGDRQAQLFVGDARVIDHTREGADWVTRIQAGDGARGYSHGRVSRSFPPGTPFADVIGFVGNALGIDGSAITKKVASVAGRQFAHGYTAHGRASTELDKVLRAAGYEWSIQDGKLQVLEPGEGTTEKVVELSSDSGLIGSPEMSVSKPRKKAKTGKAKKTKPPVLKFKALLSADIAPGRRVSFVSEKHTGIHRVLKITHSGDTHGGDWFTEGESEAL